MELAEKTRAVLRRAGAALLADRLPHHDSPIICGRFEGRDASALARELQARKVMVAARHGNLRVSPHFYNDETDLERLSEALLR
jgi:selenocysteine lyase/cysteine desulfurase